MKRILQAAVVSTTRKASLRSTVLAALLMSAASLSSAAAYYVSDCQSGAAAACVAGSDSNAGTIPDSPWQTTAKVASVFSNLAAGDQILFARGASFTNAAMRLYNTHSTGANPIVFADYSPAWAGQNSAKPILTEARAATDLFNFQDGGNADHDEGYTVRNLELRGGGTGEWGVFIYNDVDYITLENLDINGFSIGVHSAGSNAPNPGSNAINDHIVIRNSRITNNSAMGFLGGGHDVLIENNIFDNNGFGQAIFDHNIYISGASQMVVRGNTLSNSTFIAGQCQGVSLVVHGVNSGLLIENNTVIETSAAGTCYGIAVDGGYGTAEDFRGTIIRGNRIINVGGVGIGVSSCPDCIIENNVIVQEKQIGFFGIAVPDRVRGADDTPENNVTVRNNAILITQAGGSSVGIRVGTEGANHLVVSNLIRFGQASTTSSACFDTAGLAPSAFHGFDYNLCSFAGTPGKWETTHATLASWQATGLDTHSKNADPLIADPSGPAYSLALKPGSPAINAGDPARSSAKDITGRTRDARPDIGAYEAPANSMVPLMLLLL